MIFLKHYILRVIRLGTLKCPYSKILHMDFLFFLFETLRCYAYVYTRIDFFRKRFDQDLSIIWEFQLFRLAYRTK